MSLSLKELKRDGDKIAKQLQEAKLIAIQTNPQVKFLEGALAYIQDNIKKQEDKK